jgi:hypothetical protein
MTTKQQVEARIREACDFLYKEEHELIKNETHERTIVASLFCHMRSPFLDEGWDVDVEYNREGDKGDPKRDDIGDMRPDIIVHSRGSIEGPNLMALEVKGFWNKDAREEDADKLRRIRAKYNYKFLYRLELRADSYSLVEVDPQN